DGHVVLADVHQVAPGHQREIGAIVGDEQHARAVTHRRELAEERERLASRDVLRSELERHRRDRQQSRGKGERVQTTYVERPRVDNRIEATHPREHVADALALRQRDSPSPDPSVGRITTIAGWTVVAEPTRGRSKAGAGSITRRSPRPSRSQAAFPGFASRSRRMRRTRAATRPVAFAAFAAFEAFATLAVLAAFGVFAASAVTVASAAACTSPHTKASRLPFDRISSETTRSRAAPAGARIASTRRRPPRRRTR